jgi:hypothetical protein
MSTKMRSAVLLLSLLALPGVAAAGSVYLNGVNIDGVTGQRFDKASVRIDEKGNVFIEAAGYTVKGEEGTPSSGVVTASGHTTASVVTSGPPRLTKRYFLVAQQPAPGMAEYEVDVFINAKWIRKIRMDESQVPVEITRHLTPGRNKVLLAAKKNASGTRKSFSPEHDMKVIIGEGNVGGDHLMIDNPLITFRCSAAQTDDINQEYTLTTQ